MISNIIIKVKCKTKKSFNKCRFPFIQSYMKKNEILTKYKEELEEKISQMRNTALDIDDLDKLFRFNYEIDYNFSTEMYVELFKNVGINKLVKYPCLETPDKCEAVYQDILALFEAKKLETQRLLHSHNQIVLAINELKQACSNSNKEYTYIKCHLDNNYELFCTYCDYSPIFEKDTFISFDILGFYGHEERLSTRDSNKHLKMYLSYSNYMYNGSIEIVDFFASSYRKRQGHGTLAMKTLTEMVKSINVKIKKVTTEENNKDYNRMKPVNCIYGKIVPGGDISEQNLLKFYDKCGYLTNGRLYKEF